MIWNTELDSSSRVLVDVGNEIVNIYSIFQNSKSCVLGISPVFGSKFSEYEHFGGEEFGLYHLGKHQVVIGDFEEPLVVCCHKNKSKNVVVLGFNVAKSHKIRKVPSLESVVEGLERHVSENFPDIAELYQ